MRAATALLEAPLEGQKLALRRSGFPRTLASGLRALQPANTNRENPCAYDESASESCNWTTKDPIRFGGGQLNLYVYAGNDPVNNIDSNGQLWPIDLGVCIYDLFQVNNAENQCEKKYNNACPASCDMGTSESCQQFYEQYGADAPVFGCIQQTSPGLLRSLQDACGKAGIGWGNFGGRVPGLSPPLFPKP